jgi:hypothetical protein
VSALFERILDVLGVVFISAAATQTTSPSSIATVILVGAVAAMLVTALVAARSTARRMRARDVTTGIRAWHHRRALSAQPAPQHPDTAGRPRSRAPSDSTRAA